MKNDRKSSKLAISKSFQSALCTDFCISENEAEAFINKAMATSSKDADEDSDNQSKE